MKTISKAEFIAKLENELADDAQIVGFSTVAGECFELDETGDVFTVVDDEIRNEFNLDAGITHIFEVT